MLTKDGDRIKPLFSRGRAPLQDLELLQVGVDEVQGASVALQ